MKSKFTKEKVFDLICELSADEYFGLNLKKAELTEDDKISELGVNSIIFIKLLVKLEKEFNIKFEDEMLNYRAFDTIGDLIRMIEDKTA
ncbi:MAG TPA: acyl carrier protein [Firmicutes bacterium]|nr:acyl carrier protein [Bacillota bacterium]